MKAGILMIALLLASIFAGSIAFAGSNAYAKPVIKINTDISGKLPVDTSVNTEVKAEAKAVNIEEIGDLEIPEIKKEEALEKVKEFEDKRKLGFAESWRGSGYIQNGEKGFLISAFWTLQKFADKEDDAKKPETIVERAFGNLKVAKTGNYHLSMTERTENSITFEVVSEVPKDSTQKKPDEIGTLVLKKKTELIGLTIWEGTLEFSNGKLVGSWQVELITDTHVVKPTDQETPVSSGELGTKIICKLLRGDANADGNVDISDAVYINLYLNGKKKLLCKENTDVNADGKISELDREYLLDYLFRGGPKPKSIAEQEVPAAPTLCDSIASGDANTDGNVDISDAVYINMYLQGEKKLECPNAADVNGDGSVTEADREYLLSYLFEGGSKPLAEKKAAKIVEKIDKLEKKKASLLEKLKNFFLGK